MRVDIRRVETSQPFLVQYLALFQQCFPNAPHFSLAYLHWLYYENPEGPALGFDAWHGDELVAHYVCIPMRGMFNGEVMRGMLSLNTATKPGFQGRGLFTTLAERSYQAAADAGYDFIYGIANANSTPGFLRKLGFTLVAPLDAKLGFGRPHYAFSEIADGDGAFRHHWTAESIAWRIRCPGNLIRLAPLTEQTSLAYASARKYGIAVLTEVASAPGAVNLPDAPPRFTLTPNLFIGLVPARVSHLSGFFDIPRAMRPSPLNLIFKDLRGIRTLDPTNTMIDFLDFDAY